MNRKLIFEFFKKFNENVDEEVIDIVDNSIDSDDDVIEIEQDNKLTELSINDVTNLIGTYKEKLKFDSYISKGNTNIRVFIDSSRTFTRMDFMTRLIEELQSDLPNFDVKFNPYTSGSSIGGIEITEIDPNYSLIKTKLIRIVIKDINVQGSGRPGTENEEIILNEITNIISLNNSPVNVNFIDSTGNSLLYKNIVEVKDSAADVADNRKADIILYSNDDNQFNISLKMDNAARWLSGTSYIKQRSRISKHIYNIISDLDESILSYDENSNKYRLSRGLAFKVNEEDVKLIVFGSDIIEHEGAIIYKTFSTQDFKYDHLDENITINTSKILTDVEDITNELYPWLIIGNGSGGDLQLNLENEIIRYRGIRPIFMTPNKISKNHIIIDEEY